MNLEILKIIIAKPLFQKEIKIKYGVQVMRITKFTLAFLFGIFLSSCSTNYNSLNRGGNESISLIVGSEKAVLGAIYDAISKQFPSSNVQSLPSPNKGLAWYVRPMLDQTDFKLTLSKRAGLSPNDSQVVGWSYSINTYGTQGLVASRYVNPLIAEIDASLKERKIQLVKATNVTYVSEEIADAPEAIPIKPTAKLIEGFTDDLALLIEEKAEAKKNPNIFVMSVGISEYADVPGVPFANRSAKQFSEMAIKLLGANEENVITLTDTQATSGRIRGRLKTLLNRLNSKDKLIIYFAGHGVPSKDGNAAYLLAQDGGPGSFEETDFELSALYDQISKSKVGEANIFIDACFSGRSAKDTIIFEGVAPITIAKTKNLDQNGRVSIITAGRSDQFANQYKSRGHRLFGYHLMKTLVDDTNGKRSMDIYSAVRDRVLKDSRKLGVEFEQEPELLGNPNLKIRN